MTSSLLLCKSIIELYMNNKLNITRANLLWILSITRYKISLSNGRYSVYLNYMILFYRNVLIVLYKQGTPTFCFVYLYATNVISLNGLTVSNFKTILRLSLWYSLLRSIECFYWF